MTTYKSFSTIQIPEFLKDWEDTSWGNDVTASSHKTLPNGNALHVWVNPDNPAEREYAEAWKYNIILEDPRGNEINGRSANTDAECKQAIKLLESINLGL